MEKVIKETTFAEEAAQDKAWWKSRSPRERLEALNFLIRTYYGIADESARRLPRLPQIVERPLHSDVDTA